MQVEYTLIEDDYLAFKRHEGTTSTRVRRALSLFRWAPWLCLSLIVLPLLLLGLPGAGDVVGGVIGGGMAGLVVYLLFLPFVLRARSPAYWSKQFRRAGPQKIARVAIAPDGLRSTSGGQTGHCGWQKVGRIERAAESLLFWTTPNYALIVPDRAFESPAAANAFERESRAYWERARVRAAAL